MRNLKRALSLGLTAAMISGLMVMGSSAASSSYTDVADTDNVEAIEVLKAVGIMVGDESGDFNPDQKVTRNEMAVVMSNLMAYNVATYKDTSPFTDVPSWAEPYVAACWTNGITAGTSATTYGGSENVTTAQAALMLLKALGYFQYSSDFGSDWQLATVSQGNKIDLFDDVDSGVREAMTRNDLAQLVLNTLESGTVEAEKTGQDISVGDITITSGVTYKYVTSGRDYATAINDKLDTNNDGSYSSGAIVELGEKLYQGDLTKKSDAYDDFGRPAVVWEYQTKEIGTFAEKADYTFTSKVTSKALYDRVGKTAVDNYKWSVSVNGESVEYDGDKLSRNRSDNDSCFLGKAGVALPSSTDTYTGNGVITEIFVDGTDKTVDVAVINQYAAKVLKVDKDDGTITLSDVNSGPASSSDEFDSTQFAEDDVVIYTYANGDIQSVYAADKLEGDVTAVRTTTTGGSESDGDYFVVDGTTYNYNKTATKDRLLTENVNNKVVAYLDAQGYVSYIDESAITYDYAYVLSMGTDSDQYGKGSNDKGTTVYARLVLSDGTLIKVETDAKASEIGAKDSSGNYEPTASNPDTKQEYLLNHLVSYSKDKNGVYSLSDKSGMAITPSKNAALEVQNGVASMTLAGTRYTANSNTIFIIADPDTDSYDDYDFTIYTGIKNVPDIDGNSNTQVVVATESGNSKVAKVVYIEDADVSGTGKVIFARADKNAKYVKDSSIGNYYEINAWQDGKTVTLKVKENSSAADALIKSPDTTYAVPASDSSNAKYLVALKSITENSDGLVTSVRAYSAYDKTSGDGVILGTGTLDAEKSTVGLTGIQQLGKNPTGSASIRYAWTDDAISIQYNDKTGTGEFKTNRISSINDDNNDLYVAVLDGDVITGLCVVYREGGDGSTNGGTVTPGVTISIDADGKTIKITSANKNLTESQAVTEITNWLKNQGYQLGTVKKAGNTYIFPAVQTVGGIAITNEFEYTYSSGTTQNITVTINGKAEDVKNGTKVSDLSATYGKYLDNKGTLTTSDTTVLKSGDVIDLYGKVTRNGGDQYGKIGSKVDLSGNWYIAKANPQPGDTDYQPVANANVTYTVADQTISDGFYKVQIDTENPQFYTVDAPHKFTALSSTGTGFIVSEDDGKTWTYVAGKELTTSNKDLEIKKDYIQVTCKSTSGTSGDYNWTITDVAKYAPVNGSLDVKYTVTSDKMQDGDNITVTFGGVVSSGNTDKFTARGNTMSHIAYGLTVSTKDVELTISSITK